MGHVTIAAILARSLPRCVTSVHDLYYLTSAPERGGRFGSPQVKREVIERKAGSGGRYQRRA